MVNLLKTFGKGILYIIGLPFFLVALLLFGVVGLFLFLFQLIKSVIYFFTGQKFFPELPEDKELRLKKEATSAMNNPQNDVQPEPRQDNQSIIYPYIAQEPAPEPTPFMEEPDDQGTIEDACFNNVVPEPEEENVFESLVREEPKEEPVEEPAPEPEETTLETSTIVEEKEPEEELEEYVPAGSNYESDYEEENTEIGVDIDYDVR